MAKKVWKVKIAKKNDGKFKFESNFGAKKGRLIRDDYLVGNGWICSITNNKIICKSYSVDRKSCLKFVIFEDGFSKLFMIDHGKKQANIREGYVVNKYDKMDEGFIGLTVGGPITEKNAYYRSIKFQRFLSRHEIASIKAVDPNREYEFINGKINDDPKGYKFYYSEFITDGDLIDAEEDKQCLEISAEGLSCRKTYNVKNATWVLVTEGKFDEKNEIRKRYSVLYTLEKQLDDLGLPTKKEMKKKLEIEDNFNEKSER